ncbi:hypothetical protein H9X57_06955 [Flavobacterium piscinae]|nr:hypothetical protein [Flavobacterium piscinae]
MKPVVGRIGDFIFFDPFDKVGIYDATIRDNSGKIVFHPNGDPKKTNFPFIVLWLVIGATFLPFIWVLSILKVLNMLIN